MKRIYLDYASTAPLRAVAREAMLQWLGGAPNPSSLHHEGRQAHAALDHARSVFAHVLQVRTREILFTASGSESVSLALLGTLDASRMPGTIITSPIEHRAVLAAAEAMSERGWRHLLLGVDADGAIDLGELESLLANISPAEPKIVSLMLVNNELGTINDVRTCARLAHRYKALVHCDAVGAGALVAYDDVATHVDYLSLSAQKFGGPLGVGVLYAHTEAPLTQRIFGGGQEFGKRAGTENLAAIVGAAAALREAESERESARADRSRITRCV